MQRVQIDNPIDRGLGDNDVVHHGDHDDAKHCDLDDAEHGDLDDDKVSVVGWCGACVACCFSGKGLCNLFGKLPSVCKVNFSLSYLALNLFRSIGNGTGPFIKKPWRNTATQVACP